MKLRAIVIVIVIIIFSQLAACKRDLPEPEINVKPLKNSTLQNEISVFNNFAVSSNQDPFAVHYHVEGNTVFVQCVVRDFSFRKDSEQSKQGKIAIYVNDIRTDTVESATFVLKGLPRGTNKVKLAVVNEDDIPYGLEKQFYIVI